MSNRRCRKTQRFAEGIEGEDTAPLRIAADTAVAARTASRAALAADARRERIESGRAGYGQIGIESVDAAAEDRSAGAAQRAGLAAPPAPPVTLSPMLSVLPPKLLDDTFTVVVLSTSETDKPPPPLFSAAFPPAAQRVIPVHRCRP